MSPGSSVLLLENDGYIFNVPQRQAYYFAIDTSNNSIRPATGIDWNAATGEIIDDLQLSRELERPIFGWKQTDSAGRHVMGRVLSPSGDYLAIVSADGRYHKPVRALLWGREAYADGQHFLEIRPMKDGKLVGTPVAIPTEDEQEPRIWWTKDERFIIVRFYKWDNIVVVPTDIARPTLLRNGDEAKMAGYSVFQMDLWWEEWVGANEFQIRNEAPDSAVFLLNMPVLRLNTPDGYLVYRYDPSTRTLTPTDPAAWQNAKGPVSKESDLWEKDERDPRYDDIMHKMVGERTPEDREVLRKEGDREKAAMKRRDQLLAKSHPRGSIILGPFFSHDKSRFALVSYNDKDSKTFFQDVFDTQTGKRVGSLLELPMELGRTPLWTPDGRYILHANRESRLLTIMHVNSESPE